MQITLFDILILLALVGGATWGFFRGIVRQAAGLFTLYAATVISTIGYRSVSRMLGGATHPSMGLDMLSFVILMIALNLLFWLMGRDLIGHIDADRLGIWSNLGGMVLGFINAAIWCAVLLIVIRSATGGPRWIGYDGVREFFRRQTEYSWMSYVFGPFMRLVLATIRPWLFGHELPPLLINAF